MEAIVYTSNTGFTARYAKMLARHTGLPVHTLKQAKKALKKGTQILYLGWLFSGAVKGYKRAAEQFEVEALIGVGLCATGTMLDEVRKVNDVPAGLPVFTLQGGMEHKKLKGIHRLMIKMLIKMMSRAKNPSQEDRAKLALIREGGDFVSDENLSQVLAWYEEMKA